MSSDACLYLVHISIYIHLYLSIYLFSEYYYLPSPGPAVDDVVAHCLPTRWRTIVNNRNTTAAAAVIRMLRRAACNVRHRRSGPGEGRGDGGGTRNHFKIRNSCCLFEKLLAQRTQQKETREQKEGKEKKNDENFSVLHLFFSPIENLENALQKNMLNKCNFRSEFFEISHTVPGAGLFFVGRGVVASYESCLSLFVFGCKSAKYFCEAPMEVSEDAATCVINHKEFIFRTHSYAFKSSHTQCLHGINNSSSSSNLGHTECHR